MLSLLQKASQQLGFLVEEPSWIEVSDFRDHRQFEDQLKTYLKTNGTPVLVVLMLSHEKQYSLYKNICYNSNVVSQVIAGKTVRRMNLSVASNVLKQMNSKLGGDLFNLNFSKEMTPYTMLIGIDVCHAGRQSIVGFCASINKNLSQYYSEKIVQKKGQEIVDKQLKDAIRRALEAFDSVQGHLPEHFIVYRDGVGDAMRRQVLQMEIAQMKEAINETYNLAAKRPCITVVIVNKRIT